MSRSLALGVAFALLALAASRAPVCAQPAEVRAPEVVIPSTMAIPAPEALKALFPKGLVPGLGFGLNCAQGQPDGGMVLHTLTGRGPAVAGPAVVDGGTLRGSTIFVQPSFNPSIVTMKLAGSKAEVVGLLPLKNENGSPVRGLPPGPAVPGAMARVPLDVTLKPLPYDAGGIDPQGVAYDFKRGAFWLADGYRPGLARVSPRGGAVLAMVSPGAGLEEYLGTCRPGWGFSGVSVSPAGKVYTMMRGVLFVDGVPGVFSRVLEYDPDTERVRQLPYPVEEMFPDPAAVMTGDPVAYADRRILVLEQGVDKDGRRRSLVFAADLTRANNISRVFNDAGQPPEVITDRPKLAKAFALARKTLVLDLQEAGFTGGWAESMALLADGRTLAFMSGHGFGLEQQISGAVTGPDGKPVLDPSAYEMGPGGKLTFDGKPTQAQIGFRPSSVSPRLWVATLPKKVSDY